MNNIYYVYAYLRQEYNQYQIGDWATRKYVFTQSHEGKRRMELILAN